MLVAVGTQMIYQIVQVVHHVTGHVVKGYGIVAHRVDALQQSKAVHTQLYI